MGVSRSSSPSTTSRRCSTRSSCDLRRRFRADYRILTAARGPRRSTRSASCGSAATPVALFLVDQRMPAMTGTEFLREARKLHPDAKQGAAHGVRRHRGGDRGDQRGRPRSLPDEAVGSARGAALPGARRPARRLGGARCGRRTTASASSARAGRRRATRRKEFLVAQPDPVPVARRRADDAEARALLGDVTDDARKLPLSCSSPTAPCCRRRPTRETRREGRHAHAGRSAVLRPGGRSAAGRPGWRRRCTAPPRGSRPCSSSTRRPAARPAPARASRTTSASRAASRGADLARAGDGAGAALRRRAARGAGGRRRCASSDPYRTVVLGGRQRGLLLRGGGRDRRRGAQAGGPGRRAGHGRRPLLRRRADRGGPLPRSGCRSSSAARTPPARARCSSPTTRAT